MKSKTQTLGLGEPRMLKAAEHSVGVEVAALRAKLKVTPGLEYWRSLEELAATREFQQWAEREFPAGAAEWTDEISRRNFLKLAAASLALAGLNGCTKQPLEKIVPYVRQPEEIVLGEPLFYASSFVLGGYATGVLIKSREGHPIKVEGNPQHPASLGSSTVWMQAALRDLYDPDRSHVVTRNGEISTWAIFLSDLNQLLVEQTSKSGAGLRFLTETVTSPTLAAQLRELLHKFPFAKWYQYEPTHFDNAQEGARLAFGQIAAPQYRFDKAAVILSLESDFLYEHPMRLPYAREFIKGRQVSGGKMELNRLYVVESTPSITGSMADNRLAIRSDHIKHIARAMAQRLRTENGSAEINPAPHSWTKWVDAVTNDLKKHRGASIVIAGESQSPEAHALAHLINHTLGNPGETIFYTDSAEANPVHHRESLGELISEMRSGTVDTLFILGGNPVYTAPVDSGFAEALALVRRSIHLSQYLDETSARCAWHIPEAHFMESWGDARAYDGAVSMIQPLIAPLFGGKSVYELLGAMMQQQPVRNDYQIVREYWQRQNAWEDFEKGWRKALHDGFVAGTALAAKASPSVSIEIENRLLSPSNDVVDVNELEVTFRPDPHLWDGRFANNGWLQELPKPLTKLSWDNAAYISPVLAEKLRLSNGDMAELRLQDRSLTVPVWVMPGQAAQTVTLHLGSGRSRAGQVGNQVGFNAYSLRTSRAMWSAPGLTIIKTGRHHPLATTQFQHTIESAQRQVFRGGTISQFLAHPDFVREATETPKKQTTLYNNEEFPNPGYRWGMSIDLTSCIGCNACVIACEAENNIPVVGKDQIARGRDMLWIRIDTYFKGGLDNPGFAHMPVPCMHCENAPCEVVCPVAATLHDTEGLNLQVYNRCVGTRYCSNNCPYKVRRFNFFKYADDRTASLKPIYNPEVTVRWRGVMEKCTYCIQRISRARIQAKEENRRIGDGEVLTACQQACPTEAIIFGDLNDPNSRVSKRKQHPLDYSMLGQLNTRPRTTYLAELENPNPELLST